jgi:nucleoside-diphosphate-sugar epimerase
MKTALIGYTGFVGSNLSNQLTFDDVYNSQNIESIRGKTYDLVVSAGSKAERWKANQDPEGDWEGIKKLLDNLENVKAKHFILISTVDVYPNPNGATEDTKTSAELLSQAYGKNRFKMEDFVRAHFPKTTILRCPQLWGPGVKKGFIYDLIYDNALNFTHKDTKMQFYNITHMWEDIRKVIDNNIDLINFAVEPTTAAEIAKAALGIDFTNVTEKPPLVFDFKSKYSSLWNSNDGYLYHKKEILNELKRFIQNERKRHGK